ncbi:MAG: hypothetical protein HOP08_03610 [Cyclobacteriaceae bacterium]|nr:hypothetical protein [Cyclobacteriaceae bacterium]
MSPLDGKETLKNLCGKGFKEAPNKSKDHKWIEFWHDGKLTRCRTKFSHNNQEINDYLIREMSRQINLNKKEFVAFAKCTLSQPQYVAILKEKSLV